MSKKDQRRKKQPPSSEERTSRSWEQWRDADDHTGDNPNKGKYDTPQDYLGSEDYQANQPVMRANHIEQALIFMRKLIEDYPLKIKSDGIIGEKILIVLDGQGNPDAKLKDALLKAYRAAGYDTVRIEIQWG
jgi:hypothetical protein